MAHLAEVSFQMALVHLLFIIVVKKFNLYFLMFFKTHNIWGPFLVIAPASTLHNWQKEISEFLPSFKTLPYWGNPKDRNVLRKTLNKKNMIFNADAPFHVVITSYQLVITIIKNWYFAYWFN
jgi:SNF2 family DNA or RNA helicase